MEARFVDSLRTFGGAIRQFGPAIAAIVLAHLSGATGPDAIFGRSSRDGKGGVAGLLDLGIEKARGAIEDVLTAARADVALRGPEFAAKSLVSCFQDHAVPIFQDLAVLHQITTDPGASEATSVPKVAKVAKPKGKARAAA